MGRYDGPDFEVNDERVVSVWAATVSWDEIPDDYWNCDFDGGDDDPWNQFSTDFGFGCYGDDFVESYYDETGKGSVPIGDLIAPLSYSSSFVADVVKRATEIGLPMTSYVFLMYNFKYDCEITGVDASPCLRFVGVFPYSENE